MVNSLFYCSLVLIILGTLKDPPVFLRYAGRVTSLIALPAFSYRPMRGSVVLLGFLLLLLDSSTYNSITIYYVASASDNGCTRVSLLTLGNFCIRLHSCTVNTTCNSYIIFYLNVNVLINAYAVQSLRFRAVGTQVYSCAIPSVPYQIFFYPLVAL